MDVVCQSGYHVPGTARVIRKREHMCEYVCHYYKAINSTKIPVPPGLGAVVGVDDVGLVGVGPVGANPINKEVPVPPGLDAIVGVHGIGPVGVGPSGAGGVGVSSENDEKNFRKELGLQIKSFIHTKVQNRKAIP